MRALTPLATLLALAAAAPGLGALAAAAAAPGLPGEPDPRALARWHHGPVRYILTGPEAELYRSLTDDRQREVFIRRFWALRDPDPATLRNETRERFWTQVARANGLFTRTSVPGWRTDMGRVYIMLGPPLDREYDPMPSANPGIGVTVPTVTPGASGSTTTRIFGRDDPRRAFYGLERWIYRNQGVPGLRAEFVVAFARRADGEFELSTNPRDVDRFADGLSAWVPGLDTVIGTDALESTVFAQTADRPLFEDASAMGGEPAGTAIDPTLAPLPGAVMLADPATIPAVGLQDAFNRLALILDLGRIQNAPSYDQLMGELITSREFFGVVPFPVQIHFYKTTGDEALATVTAGLPAQLAGAGAGPLALALRAESLDGSFRVVSAEPGLFRPAPAGGGEGALAMYQALVRLPPGRHRVAVGVHDTIRGLIASGEQMVDVPDFLSFDLAVSSLCLARTVAGIPDLGPLTPETAAEAFRLGSYRVVPRLERRLRQDETLAIYYQVYGPPGDEASLSATYSLTRIGEEGEQAMGEPVIIEGLGRSAQGWSLPVSGWPAGSYRLRVSVTDAAGDAAETEVIFAVAGDDPGAPAGG